MAVERMLGIVGGVGPESTADYYRRLVSRWRERRPAGTYPSILLDSLNSRPALDPLLAGDLEPTLHLFHASVARLAGAGARLALIASVTMHLAFDQVATVAPIPMLSILDALVDAARAGGIRRPGVVATRPTTEGEFFARPFEAAGIELVRPDEADLAFVHDVYVGELVNGRYSDETRSGLVDVIERMKSRHNIDAVILGGTELPLILGEPTYAGVPVLDATEVHVEAAIDWLLGH
jgi:aspartate racemase